MVRSFESWVDGFDVLPLPHAAIATTTVMTSDTSTDRWSQRDGGRADVDAHNSLILLLSRHPIAVGWAASTAGRAAGFGPHAAVLPTAAKPQPVGLISRLGPASVKIWACS